LRCLFCPGEKVTVNTIPTPPRPRDCQLNRTTGQRKVQFSPESPWNLPMACVYVDVRGEGGKEPTKNKKGRAPTEGAEDKEDVS